MKIQILCALLFLVEIFATDKGKTGPDEEAKFEAFIKVHVDAFFNPLDASLDPWKSEPVHDIFFYTPQLVLGGDITEFSFGGFSKHEDLEISVYELDIPPKIPRGSYYLNMTLPVVVTGNFKLNGVWREDTTEIPFGGEGTWTLTGEAIRFSRNAFSERRPGYIGHVALFESLDLQNPTLDMPGLFGDDVPAHVTESVLTSIREELWKVYLEEVQVGVFGTLQGYIETQFKATPFADIVGIEALPTQKHVQPPAPTWPQMDKFVAGVMNEFSGLPAEGLDPLRDLDVSIQITYPTNLNLSGTISDLTFIGAKDIRHKSSYSPIDKNAITIYSVFPNAYLTGRHNIAGTITLESGEVLTVGGVESDFVFKARPASSSIYYLYKVDCDTGAIELETDRPFPATVTFELKDDQNMWDIDLHGLLDELPPSELKDTTKNWIADSIEAEVAEKLMRKIEYRIEKVLNNAFKQTTYGEIAQGSHPNHLLLPC